MPTPASADGIRSLRASAPGPATQTLVEGTPAAADPPVPARVPNEEAERHHARAVAHMQKAQWKAALAECLRAVQLDDGNPDYEACYASLLLQAGPPGRNTDAQIEAHLRRALKLDLKCAQAHHGLGLLLKRQGEHEDAEVHFQTAFDVDPSLLDAARHLRLYAARRARNAESGLIERVMQRLRPARAQAASAKRNGGKARGTPGRR